MVWAPSAVWVHASHLALQAKRIIEGNVDYSTSPLNIKAISTGEMNWVTVGERTLANFVPLVHIEVEPEIELETETGGPIVIASYPVRIVYVRDLARVDSGGETTNPWTAKIGWLETLMTHFLAISNPSALSPSGTSMTTWENSSIPDLDIEFATITEIEVDPPEQATFEAEDITHLLACAFTVTVRTRFYSSNSMP